MDSPVPAQSRSCDACIFFLGVLWRAERQIARCGLFGDAPVNASRGCGAWEAVGAPQQYKIGTALISASARAGEVEAWGDDQ